MALPALESPGGQLDELLAEICRQLQITEQQRQRAETSYGAIGEWLGRSGGRLSAFDPQIYPQGSIAIGTTVKPRESDEYDVDLVLEVGGYEGNAMRLYEDVRADLYENETYRSRLQLKSRCLRINYAGDFHLDVLPARHDDIRGGTAVEVPDRSLRTWKPSNPRGFREWFESRAAVQMNLIKAAAEELPAEEPADLKAVLKRVVQLVKRQRDVAFEKEFESAPRSIVLTTLCGEHPPRVGGVADTLDDCLDWIESRIREAGTDRVRVHNPTNRDEDLSEAWDTDDRTMYQSFVRWVRTFADSMKALRSQEGLDSVGIQLERMFGEKVAWNAIDVHLKRVRAAEKRGKLRSTRSGLSVATGPAIPKHRNFGS